jgi:dTMP kinase
LCSLEGISGVGKSYLTRVLRAALADLPMTFVTEVVDRTGHDLDRDMIGLLAKSADRFFRGGRPLTETFLLLALKMFDYEVRIAPALAEGRIVLEDRSLDTIAIYQALILYPDSPERQLETAHAIYALGSQWRRPPQLTFLIEEEFALALARLEQREGHPIKEEERSVLERASALYTRYAQTSAKRIVRLQRQHLSTEALVQTIREHLLPLHAPIQAHTANVPPFLAE